jgi:signal peptidase I
MKSALRRFIDTSLLFLCVLLLLRAVAAEPYIVPTASMAPAILGHHKAVVCPRCGYTVRVATESDTDCPNCGCPDLALDRAPVCPGDHVLVNKFVYDWRSPRRWEMGLFRSPVDESKVLIKRIIGLPGESVEIRGGDVYIDHEIARKTLAEFKALRIPVFDNDDQPPGGWSVRWLKQPEHGPVSADDCALRLEAQSTSVYHWLAYRHTLGITDKARAISDEYPNDGGDPMRTPEPVHDFMLECDAQVRSGDGWLALGLNDGGSETIAELPVGTLKDGARLSEWPVNDGDGVQTVYRTVPSFGLRAGQSYHVEFAFVDRRASLAVDGRQLFASLDRPSLAQRAEVVQPARIGARGVEVVVQHFRLYRDVHYTALGRYAVGAPVRLGAAQYFVLGDNSPNSDDSRFWSDAAGRPRFVAEGDLLGKPFLLHLPTALRDGAGGRPRATVDWDRMRWLH